MLAQILIIWQASSRAGNDPYWIESLLFCCEASKLVNLFSNLFYLVLRVNKVHCAVLKLFVYQFYFLNSAKTASELGFKIHFVWNFYLFRNMKWYLSLTLMKHLCIIFPKHSLDHWFETKLPNKNFKKLFANSVVAHWRVNRFIF